MSQDWTSLPPHGANLARSSQVDPSDTEAHKNEGFLKSMWHTLTNHPAHQKEGEGGQSGTTKKEDKKQNKPDEAPKKSSDSGSG